MPFVKRTDSKHFQIPTDTRKIFIGRSSELHFFIDHILKPEDPDYNIVSVSGNGGVGKSTLLARFRDETRVPDFRDYCLTAFIDKDQITPAGMMEKFAEQLSEAGSPLTEFEKAFTRYQETLRKLQAEQEAAKDTALRETADLVGIVAEDIVPGGKLLHKSANVLTELYLKERSYRQSRKDAELLENPIGDLTSIFVEELNRLTDTQITLSSHRTRRRLRVILFFDTFEQLAAEAAPWLLDYFLQANISTNVILVVAGRDSIERSTPNDPKRWLQYRDDDTLHLIDLDSFTKDETHAYLTERGIADPERITEIWEVSRGLPLYLSLLTFNPRGNVDPTANVVANFLRGIPEQERVKHQIALDAALFSRPFSQDDLAAFTYIPEDEYANLYHWLIKLPFVQSSSQTGQYNYHELARELFSRHLYGRSQREYYATRNALAVYYQQSLENIHAQRGKEVYNSPEWLELILALAFQQLLLPDKANHIHAVKQIMDAYEYAKQTEEIVRTLQGISQEHHHNQISISARQIAKELLDYIEADQTNDTQQLLVAISKVLKEIVQTPSNFSTELLARLYCKRAFAYWTLKIHQQAIEDVDHAHRLNPKYTEAYLLYRGLSYFSLDKYQQAIEDFDRTLTIDSRLTWVYIKRGEAYCRLKKYRQAIQDFNTALSIDPNSAMLYAKRGIAHFALEEYQQAIQDFDHARELSPEDLGVRNIRGRTYYSSEEYQQMLVGQTGGKQEILSSIHRRRGRPYRNLDVYKHIIANLNYTIELDPGDTQGYIDRGKVYHLLNEYQKAIEDFNRALTLDPQLVQIYYFRGETYRLLDDHQKAIKDFDHALALDPNCTEAYSLRGETHRLLNNYHEAMKDFDHALALDPKLAWVYASRGSTYRNMKEYKLALKDYDRALALDPKLTWVYASRGIAYLRLKDIQRALTDFHLSRELDPTDVNASWLAEWSEMCQQKTKSNNAERLEAITAFDPQQYTAIVCLGVALWVRGRLEEALVQLERAIPIDIEEWDGYFWKGMVCASLGKDGEALVALEKALTLDIPLPPMLLAPLRWLEKDKPNFYEKYVVPLLQRYNV